MKLDATKGHCFGLMAAASARILFTTSARQRQIVLRRNFYITREALSTLKTYELS